MAAALDTPKRFELDSWRQEKSLVNKRISKDLVAKVLITLSVFFSLAKIRFTKR